MPDLPNISHKHFVVEESSSKGVLMRDKCMAFYIASTVSQIRDYLVT